MARRRDAGGSTYVAARGRPPVARTVLIDEGKSHLGQEHRGMLTRDYDKVLYVGKEGAPAAGSGDREVASFCHRESCDLLTSDKEAYASMLEDGRIGEVCISRYVLDKSGQQVYRIRMQ